MADEVVNRLTADFLKALAHPVRVEALKMLTPGERCWRCCGAWRRLSARS